MTVADHWHTARVNCKSQPERAVLNATGGSAWFWRLATPRRRRQVTTVASAPATQEGPEVCFKQQAVTAQCLREEVMPPMHFLPGATSAALLLTWRGNIMAVSASLRLAGDVPGGNLTPEEAARFGGGRDSVGRAQQAAAAGIPPPPGVPPPPPPFRRVRAPLDLSLSRLRTSSTAAKRQHHQLRSAGGVCRHEHISVR